MKRQILTVFALLATLASMGCSDKRNAERVDDVKSSQRIDRAVTQTPKSDPLIEALPPRIKEPAQETGESVLMEWGKQYEYQQKVLKWPRELGEDFLVAVRRLQPIETKVRFPTPPSQQLKSELRHLYAAYANHQLPKLGEVIRSRWNPQSNATEKEGVPERRNQSNPDPERTPEVVHWSPVNQARLVKDHFDWSSQPDGAPSTLQLLYAQEDLWVLEVIVRIIRKTNGDSRSNEDAVVKAIESILIGRDTVVHNRGADQRDPADGRYVDGKGAPLSGDQLRSAMRSAAGDPRLAIAKRIPVCMKLVVDQQHVNELLIACGDSPLPLEVGEVRLDGAALPDPLAEPTNKEAADKEPQEGNPEKLPKNDIPRSCDAVLELAGLMYIYNPVEKE